MNAEINEVTVEERRKIPHFLGIIYIVGYLFTTQEAALWILGFTLAGYFFGGIPIVQQNFNYIIYAIIALSLFSVASIVVGVFRTVRTCAADDDKEKE